MSTPTPSTPEVARQLAAAIKKLVAHVGRCRGRCRNHAEEHPDDLKGLLLPLEDMALLERLDGEAYGLAAAAGLTVLPAAAPGPPRGAMGYTGIPIVHTWYIPEPGRSDVILAAGLEYGAGEWDARMAALLTAAEAMEDPAGRKEEDDPRPERPTREYCLVPPNFLRWIGPRLAVEQRYWHFFGLVLDFGDKPIHLDKVADVVHRRRGNEVESKTVKNAITQMNAIILDIGIRDWCLGRKGEHVVRKPVG